MLFALSHSPVITVSRSVRMSCSLSQSKSTQISAKKTVPGTALCHDHTNARPCSFSILKVLRLSRMTYARIMTAQREEWVWGVRLLNKVVHCFFQAAPNLLNQLNWITQLRVVVLWPTCLPQRPHCVWTLKPEAVHLLLQCISAPEVTPDQPTGKWVKL